MTTWLPLNFVGSTFRKLPPGVSFGCLGTLKKFRSAQHERLGTPKTTRLTSVRTVVIALVAQLAEQGDETPIAQVRVLSSASIPG